MALPQARAVVPGTVTSAEPATPMESHQRTKPTRVWKNTRSVEQTRQRAPHPNIHLEIDPLRERSVRGSNAVTTSKYTLWTLLPKNLFEQFRRVANFYFLIIALLQQIGDLSPTGKTTTALPLTVVLFVTLVKEAFEDWQRHRQDSEHNSTLCTRVRNGVAERVPWRDVDVGDILRIHNDEFFPADMILVSSANANGMCYIETANLDGETNLKVRTAPTVFRHYRTNRDVREMSGSLDYEPPNPRLYTFYGTLHAFGKTFPLSVQETLLRGACLKNTEYVYGIVIYAGHKTKLVMNAKAAPSKRSRIEKYANKLILFLLSFQAALCILCAGLAAYWSALVSESSTTDGPWYLQGTGAFRSGMSYALESCVSFLILFNNLVPISLYVSLEIVKFVQALYISWDRSMVDESTGVCAQARTSNLNEELGQIQYIFSDKTGTLTENRMIFRAFSVGTMAVGAKNHGAHGARGPEHQSGAPGLHTPRAGPALLGAEAQRALAHPTYGPLATRLLQLMALCNTVTAEEEGEHESTRAAPRSSSAVATPAYRGPSPDDEALVLAAAQLGQVLVARSGESATVHNRLREQNETYKILHTLDFTSDRKRMSVIVQEPSGSIVLYCKGADSVILPRLAGDASSIHDIVNEHLHLFATEGLRTLCCAYRELSAEEFASWDALYSSALCAVDARDSKVFIHESARAALSGTRAYHGASFVHEYTIQVEAAIDMVERSLSYIGITAIEDKLQGGVPRTLQVLQQAGIRIWVLTGDKLETAVSIAGACRLIGEDDRILTLQSADKNELLSSMSRMLREPLSHAGLGGTMHFVTATEKRGDSH